MERPDTFYRVKHSDEDTFTQKSQIARLSAGNFRFNPFLMPRLDQQIRKSRGLVTKETLNNGDIILRGNGVCACASIEDLVSHIQAAHQPTGFFTNIFELVKLKGTLGNFPIDDEGDVKTYIVKPTEVTHITLIPPGTKTEFLDHLTIEAELQRSVTHAD